MHSPQGRAGYLKWREELKRFHARTVAALMAEAGYPPDSLAKVCACVRARGTRAGVHGAGGGRQSTLAPVRRAHERMAVRHVPFRCASPSAVWHIARHGGGELATRRPSAAGRAPRSSGEESEASTLAQEHRCVVLLVLARALESQVDSIINKKNLKDAEHQVIEDALCLGEPWLLPLSMLCVPL